MTSSRYLTIQQIEPFVKDMMFFVDFMEKHGERVDLTVDMAMEWANDIDWEKAAQRMFGEERQRAFFDYQSGAKARRDTDRDALETAYMGTCTKAAADYDASVADMKTDLNAKTAVLEKNLNEGTKDDATIGKTVEEWMKENKAVVEAFHTVSAPYKGVRDEITTGAKARYKAALEAVETAYNRSLANQFATLYINC